MSQQQYDPSKRYQWEPEKKFELTGQEYALLLNSIRAILSTPESQKVIMLEKAHDVLENKLKEGVEKGEIKETPS